MSKIEGPALLVLERKQQPCITKLGLKLGQNPEIESVNSFASLFGVPDGIASRDGKVYWTEMGKLTSGIRDFTGADGSINVVEYNGAAWVTSEVCRGIVTPKQCCLSGGYLYFCDREGLGVYRLALASNKLELLYSSGTPDHMLDYERQNVGIAVREGRVFFTQKGPKKGGRGKILSMDIGKEPKVLLDKLPEPIDLAFDPNSRLLYWTDRGDNTLNVAEYNHATNSLANHQRIVDGFGEAIGLALFQGYAFVTDLDGNLYCVDIARKTKELIYAGGPMTGVEIVP